MPRHLRQYTRAAAVVAALGLAAGLLAGCAPEPAADDGGPTGADPVAGGTLTFGRTASVTDLDLNQQITANNAFAIDKIFESLVAFDADGKIQPWLAESYDVSDDGLTYTFHLRDGVEFSDGTALSADDVVFSLNRHLDVEGPLPLSAPIDSIVATDEKTVTITLTAAYTPFLGELSEFSNGVFPADFGGRSEADFFQHPIGTGPFALDEWDPAGDISFVKNEHYWQDGKPYLDGLVFKLVPEDTQLVQQLQSAQLDAIDEVNPANVAELDANDAVQVLQSTGWEIEQIFFNTKDEHFADAKVRQAVAYALDRDGIAQATTFGLAKVANSLIPPTIEYSADEKGYALEHDVDAAKAALAESAYPDGFEIPLLIAAGNSQRAQEAQIIQDALGQIGITVTIESIDIAAFRDRFKALDYSFMINSGISDAPDPDGLVSFQADPEGFSQSYWTSYTNPDVTELMLKGRTTPDGADREQIYLDIQKILAQDVPYIPLFYPENVKATTSDVHGLVVLPNGSVRFQDAWIAQ